jgi:hypothetical protein
MRTTEQSLRLRTKVLVVFLAALIVYGGANWLLVKNERAECIQWTQEVQGSTLFIENIADWQRDQCESVGVPLPELP